MTKRNWIDLIIDWLAGGDAPTDVKGRYHPEIIGKHVAIAYNTIIHDAYNEALSANDMSQLDNFTKAYSSVPVVLDSARDRYYSNFPAGVAKLPKNSSIRHISPMKDEANAFAYIENTSISVFSELEVSQVDDIPAYFVEGDKVFYHWRNEMVETVLMKLVVPFDEFSDTDEVSIPAGKDQMVFGMIAELLRGKPPEDVINDNNAKQI